MLPDLNHIDEDRILRLIDRLPLGSYKYSPSFYIIDPSKSDGYTYDDNGKRLGLDYSNIKIVDWSLSPIPSTQKSWINQVKDNV